MLRPVDVSDAQRKATVRKPPGGEGLAKRDAEERTREWSDSTGKFKVVADFVDYMNGAVTLKKQDGSTIKVPLKKLSAADRTWLTKYLKQQRSRS